MLDPRDSGRDSVIIGSLVIQLARPNPTDAAHLGANLCAIREF
jgi:hypothetical protein